MEGWVALLLLQAGELPALASIVAGGAGIPRNDSVLLLPGRDYVLAPGLEARYAALGSAAGSRHRRGATGSLATARAAARVGRTIELAIFTDRALFSYVRERYPEEPVDGIDTVITELTRAVVSSVQLYLNHASLGQAITLKIVHLEIQPDPAPVGAPGLEPRGDIRQYLDSFCVWQRGRMSRKSEWDHALLLTGLDLYTSPDGDTGSSGMAYLSGMCSQQASCTISEARSLGTAALIVAHELAHNLGVDHDGEGSNRDCSADGSIMGPQLSAGATAWSKCSRRSIGRFLDLYGSCLEGGGGEEPAAGGRDQLPGRRFPGDQQCHLMYGAGWTLYTGVVRGKPARTCEAIWCRSGFSLRSPNAAALQGTACARESHCMGGACVPTSAGSTQDRPTLPTLGPTRPPITSTRHPVRPSSTFSNTVSVCKFFAEFGIRLSICPV